MTLQYIIPKGVYAAICAGISACCIGGTAWGAENTVHEKTLSNGLKVIVKEDHRAPVVVSEVWYKVGASYEHDGITGLSHVLEHMMFKGTKKHPPNEFSRIISQNGGRENAFTGRDYTAYYQQLEKSRLPISFELEADRMRNLALKKEEFVKEVQVVMEERRMRTEDEPTAVTNEQFYATAYVNSPYSHPVIGWMNDLENMTVEDLQHWYETWYAPNNATLVVVGDVVPAEVFKLAEKYYGPLKKSVIPKQKPSVEIPQRGQRRIVVKAKAEVPILMMGYKAPSLKDMHEEWEPYALEVLAAVLDGGSSARFAKNLVRGTQIASSVDADYDAFTPRRELFVVSGTPAQNKTIPELEAAIRAQLEPLKTELIGDDELSRIKAQVVAAKVYEKDTVYYQAMLIGMLETMGFDWRMGEQYVDKIRAITAEQVRSVAQRYLLEDQLTVAVLEPQAMDNSPTAPRSGGMKHVR
ncbi:MAG: insulinase family protein [Gammaproteobacteria bacterium]|nr:insulinase family protein [Gammaproteobacteria bacterium]